MRSQNSHSPVCRSCHCNKVQNNSFYNNNRKLNVVETCTIEDDCCCKYKNKRLQNPNSSFQGDSAELDEDTLNVLCALRKKACKFINSESDYTTTNDSVPHSNKCCNCQNQNKEEKYLIRIEDLLEYSPQSQFLKKLKRHFQCVPNDQSIPSIFNNTNEFISNSVEINENSREISKLQNKESRKECKCCTCNQKEKLTEKRSKTPRSESVNLKGKISTGQKSKKGSQERKKDSHPDEYATKNNDYKKTTKKSQHISRSRKPVKYRGRRKKISKDSEKATSQENFEPTLKRPFEDSCERCWKYASPSRSPVNKPDQKYNPNFRRAHSWQDFSTLKESSSEYVNSENFKNSEIFNKNTGPIKREQELTKEFDFPSAQTRHPLSNYTSARMKEFETQRSLQKGSVKNYQNSASAEDVKRRQAPVNQPGSYSSKERKPRPKSYTTGVSPRNLGMSPYSENLDSTEYAEIQTRKETSSAKSKKKSPKSKVNATSRPLKEQSSMNEKTFHKTKKKSSSPTGKRENSDGELLSRYGTVKGKRKNGLSTGKLEDSDAECLPGYGHTRGKRQTGAPTAKPEDSGAEWLPGYMPMREKKKTGPPTAKPEDGGAEWLPGYMPMREKKKTGPPIEAENSDAEWLPKDEFVKGRKKNAFLGGKLRNNDAEWIPQQEFVSVDFSKPPHCVPNTPLNMYDDTTRTLHSKSTINRPPSRYIEQDRNKIYSPRSASPKNMYDSQMADSTQYYPQEYSRPAKIQSSHTLQNKYLPPQERPRTVDYSDYGYPSNDTARYPGNNIPRYTSNNILERMPRSEPENQFRQPQHEFRPCHCQRDRAQKPLQTRQREYSYDRSEKKKEYCCHCRRNNSTLRNSYASNELYQERPCNEMPRSAEVNKYDEQGPENSTFNPCRCNEWQEVDNYASDEHRGKIVLCPYKQGWDELNVTQETEYPENQKYYSRGNQNYQVYPEPERRNLNRRGQSNLPNYVPTNYCVFYMKKNKENKEDEVEVLVEELIEKPRKCTKKDCKVRGIEEKMRKILESHTDSMALRFQKGVSEVTKHPESSRTLYF